MREARLSQSDLVNTYVPRLNYLSWCNQTNLSGHVIIYNLHETLMSHQHRSYQIPDRMYHGRDMEIKIAILLYNIITCCSWTFKTPLNFVSCNDIAEKTSTHCTLIQVKLLNFENAVLNIFDCRMYT